MARRRNPAYGNSDRDGINETAQVLAMIAKCAFLVFVFWLAWQCAFPKAHIEQARQAHRHEQIYSHLRAAQTPPASFVVYSSAGVDYYYPTPDCKKVIP